MPAAQPHPCPCGAGAPLDGCCGPFLSGRDLPPTAEALMRSRYTAYALAEVDYLLRTHAARTRPARQDIADWAAAARFTGLQVLQTHAGGTGDATGTVTFVARFVADGQVSAMAERSRFERDDGRWVYVDGEQP